MEYLIQELYNSSQGIMSLDEPVSLPPEAPPGTNFFNFKTFFLEDSLNCNRNYPKCTKLESLFCILRQDLRYSQTSILRASILREPLLYAVVSQKVGAPNYFDLFLHVYVYF
jgi:hypothetical protein